MTASPAIGIRATTGRWAFQIHPGANVGEYVLIATFTSRQSPARLKAIGVSGLSPEEVWPGAQVQTEPDGGFTLIDYFKPSIEAAVGPSALALRTVARAKQLHRLL